MRRQLKVFAALSVFLLTTMCTFYDQSGAVVAPNGLSCQTQTDFEGLERQQSARCYYQCPDGTGRQPEIPGEFSSSSPLYSASKEELDAQFCDGALPPAQTQPAVTDSPTPTIFTTEPPTLAVPATETPTSAVSATVLPTEEVSTSATAEIAAPPLLRGDVTMCDVGVHLINFRMVEANPDLEGQDLEVQIAGQRTTCSINPVNTSLLTCTIPAGVTFPSRVVVRLNGSVVNDFTYSGLGCAEIATAFPTTTP
jgi:hypothetical protein